MRAQNDGRQVPRFAWRDGVFVERLWKSVKYKEIYLHGYETVSEIRQALTRYSIFTIAVARIRRLTGK